MRLPGSLGVGGEAFVVKFGAPELEGVGLLGSPPHDVGVLRHVIMEHPVVQVEVDPACHPQIVYVGRLPLCAIGALQQLLGNPA